jgi:hypothetical protein
MKIQRLLPVLFLPVLIWVAWLRLLPSFPANLEFLKINRALSGESAFSADKDSDPTRGLRSYSDSVNPRIAGYESLILDNREFAAEAFGLAGWKDRDFITLARNHVASNPSRAIRWLSLTRLEQPEDQQTVDLLTARLCQPNWQLDPSCQLFLKFHDNNHFVNTDFAYQDLGGWRVISAEGVRYDSELCPKLDDRRCGVITVIAGASSTSAGLGQCFEIVPGQMYRYSAWIKVETEPEGIWRPLYLQGTIGGETKGNWPGDQTGSSNWEFQERTYEGQSFDQRMACFYPVRLSSPGRAWLANPSLVPLSSGFDE